MKLAKFAVPLLAALILVEASVNLYAAEEVSKNDKWEFIVEPYMWAAAIDVTSSAGTEIEIDFSDIMDDFEFAAMGLFGARKGKWSFMTDVIYLDIEQDDIGIDLNVPLPDIITPSGRTLASGSVNVDVDADVELNAWVVTPFVGYRLIQTEKVKLDVVAGARYLYIKVPVKADITEQVNIQLRRRGISDIQQREIRESPKGHTWDGIVGVRGEVNVNEKWYIPYYGDVGAGDSQLTWQVAGGIGYRFSKLDVVAGYRYMDWNWNDDDDALGDLNISGPYMGVKFVF